MPKYKIWRQGGFNKFSLLSIKSPIFFSALWLTVLSAGQAQNTENNRQSTFFVEPEVMMGTIVPNYLDYPDTKLRTTYTLNFGVLKHSKEKHSSRFYNFPSTGFSLSYSSLGNNEIFGKEFTAMPYILIKNSRRKVKSTYFKFGLGASYFTKKYDAIDNQVNEVIGSKLTWAFQAFLYRNVFTNEHVNLKIGAGFLHSSNGHTQLPNFGMNSAMISIAAQFYKNPVDPLSLTNTKDIDKTKHFFVDMTTGIGMHELGGTQEPIGGDKKAVYAVSVGGGVIFRQHMKVRTGFGYRYYDSYHDYIQLREYPKYIDHPGRYASNVFFYLGAEYTLGHVGMDIQGGLNLYKPFYEQFHDEFVHGSSTQFWLKKLFNTRLGLNLYLINTNKLPQHNVFLGANINANFGRADFSGLSLGYTRMIK